MKACKLKEDKYKDDNKINYYTILSSMKNPQNVVLIPVSLFAESIFSFAYNRVSARQVILIPLCQPSWLIPLLYPCIKQGPTKTYISQESDRKRICKYSRQCFMWGILQYKGPTLKNSFIDCTRYLTHATQVTVVSLYIVKYWLYYIKKLSFAIKTVSSMRFKHPIMLSVWFKFLIQEIFT